MPVHFALAERHNSSLRQSIADALRANIDRLSLVASKPRILDLFVAGYPVSGLAIATEQLSRIPFPPARKPERRIPVILDCRRIMQGFLWLLAVAGRVSYRHIVALLQHRCPPGYDISVTGATLHGEGAELYFQVDSGCVLTVSFDRALTSMPTVTDDSDDKPHSPSGKGRRSDTPPEHLDGSYDANMRSGRTPSRSRSPAQHPRLGASAVQDSHSNADACSFSKPATTCTQLAPTGLGDMWSIAFSEDALLESTQCLTPVSPIRFVGRWCKVAPADIQCHVDSFCSYLLARLCKIDPLWPRVICKLLQEPVSALPGTARAFAATREATHRLGFRWPFPPHLLPIQDADTEDTPDQASAEELVFANFVLLAPDYTPEVVPMQIVIPQSVEDILDLISTCRNAELRDLGMLRSICFFPAWMTL